MNKCRFVVRFRYLADDKLRVQRFESPLLAFRSIGRKLDAGNCQIISVKEEFKYE